MKRRREKNLLRKYVAVFLVSVLICLVAVGIATFARKDEKIKQELPKIEIFLKDGLTLEEINKGEKDIKYDGNEVAITENGVTMEYANVEIKGRGNTTWTEPKKPYRIKFMRKVEILGLKKVKKWALLAYYSDTSLLRGDLGFYVARLINSDYPLEGEFANVAVNGEDLGLYYVTPTITIGKNVVDLREPLGVLVELDGAWYDYTDDVKYKTVNGDYLVVKDVASDDLEEEAAEMFGREFDKFEEAVKRNDFAGAAEIMDMRSLAEYFLFSEFMQNSDAYLTSFYFYKDGEEDKIHAGPMWDFDGTMENNNWRERQGVRSFVSGKALMRWVFIEEDEVRVAAPSEGDGMSYVMYKLMMMPEFMDLVRRIYVEKLAGKKDVMLSYLQEKADYIRDDAIRNNELWGVGDYEAEVEYLKWWVETRFRLYDSVYGGRVLMPSEIVTER